MTIPNDKLQLETYLLDLGNFLKKDAREVAKEYRAASSADNREFLSGKLLAYYEVITTMQQQAHAFCLPLESLSLADINPDDELL